MAGEAKARQFVSAFWQKMGISRARSLTPCFVSYPCNTLVQVGKRANGEPMLTFLDAGIVTELGRQDSDNFLALFDGIAHGNGQVCGCVCVCVCGRVSLHPLSFPLSAPLPSISLSSPSSLESMEIIF